MLSLNYRMVFPVLVSIDAVNIMAAYAAKTLTSSIRTSTEKTIL